LSIYNSNPISLRQLVTARKQANFDVGKPPIDRDKTVKAFTDLRTEENRLICEQILEGRIEEIKNAKDNSAQDNFMLTQKCRAFDKLAIEMNLSESVFNDAVWYYRIGQSKESNELEYLMHMNLKKAMNDY